MPNAGKYLRIKEIAQELMGMVDSYEGEDSEEESEGQAPKKENYAGAEGDPVTSLMRKPEEDGENGMSRNTGNYTNASGGNSKGMSSEEKSRQMKMIVSKLKTKMKNKY